MDQPTLGTITYFVGEDQEKGIEISKFSNDKLALFRRDHAGFVFQQNYLNDTMSALDNVMISGLIGCDLAAMIPAGSGPIEAGTVLKGFFTNR